MCICQKILLIELHLLFYFLTAKFQAHINSKTQSTSPRKSLSTPLNRMRSSSIAASLHGTCRCMVDVVFTHSSGGSQSPRRILTVDAVDRLNTYIIIGWLLCHIIEIIHVNYCIVLEM